MPLLKFTSIALLLLFVVGCSNSGVIDQTVDANVESSIIDIPNQAAVDFKLAIGFMNDKKMGLAEKHLLKMTLDYPVLSGPFANLGVIYSQQEEWDKSVEMLKVAHEKNKNNIKILNQLGYVYRQKGSFYEAEKCYLNAIELAPRDSSAYLNVGVLYDIYMGKFVKASNYYQKYQRLQDSPDRKVAGWIVDINRRAGIKANNTQIASEAP
jgi:tetratricopeptide (TPR) repeat protein